MAINDNKVIEIYPDKEQIRRNFTSEEIAQRQKDLQEAEIRKKNEEDKELAKSALLERLGITAEEAKLLLS